MKTKLLLFLALATAAHAGIHVGDRMIVPPGNGADGAIYVGNVTLSRPGVYVAASWIIVGQLRLATPGDYTLKATTGGVHITGQLTSPAGASTLHLQYAGGFNSVVGSIAGNVTMIDETAGAGELPIWMQTFTVAVGDHLVYSPPLGAHSACQWRRNGVAVPGATQPSLTLPSVRLSDAGIYTVDVTTAGGTRTLMAAVIAIRSTTKVIGDATEAGSDILHANGRRYDQLVLTGATATVTADPGQVTRLSYIDLNDDIVQVELSGAGSLTLVLADASGPALPKNYNQDVRYMKGHATILLADSDATTNVSVFSVGRTNAVNPALFKEGVTYDGIADIGAIGILGRAGRIGGLFMGNAQFFGASGFTGVFAPGIECFGPVRLGNVSAFDGAISVLVFGRTSAVEITGGDLLQDNGRPVQIEGVDRIRFAAGGKSDGTMLPAQANRATLMSFGLDVTAITVTP